LGTFDADGTLKPAVAFQRLVQMLQTTGAQLAILDNVAHLFTGNENDRGEVTRFVNLLNRLAGETGAAILLLGHPYSSGGPRLVVR
jgi:RecA-family ATPase